jgi:hypothetical protein
MLLLALGFSTAPRAHAQPQYVTVEIYKVKQALVCGRPYSDLAQCAQLTAAKFDWLRNSRLLERAWQSDRLPPDAKTFSPNLSGDANWIAEHAPNNGLAALMVVTWNGPPPKTITITRTDEEGNNLNTRGDFRVSPRPGRTFYHFPYDQIGRTILNLRSRYPERTISYANF